MVAFSGLATTLKSSKLAIANYLHRISIALTRSQNPILWQN
ncbi:hypothetical protein [Microcoleus sp. Pol12B5]